MPNAALQPFLQLRFPRVEMLARRADRLLEQLHAHTIDQATFNTQLDHLISTIDPQETFRPEVWVEVEKLIPILQSFKTV